MHITKYVKLPISKNKKTMLRYNVMFCLQELCCAHTNKNVSLKFLGKKWGAKRICSEYHRK